MLQQQLLTILATFRANAESVKALMNFDQVVLDFAIRQLKDINGRLANLHEFSNVRVVASNSITALTQIRQNESLKTDYAQMLNQCNVLLVSYFSSAAADIFRAGVTDAVKNGTRDAILKEKITIELDGLREIEGDIIERSGDLFLSNHREINLQNMHSIAEAFENYFGYKRLPDEVVNDIILSHACRHVIVHCGAIADWKMVRQLKSAHPRTLKPDVSEHQRIQFSQDEILVVADQMTTYLQGLSAAIGY